MNKLEDKQIQDRLKAKGNLPRHIAIIMDGNGRWARMRGLDRIEGHRAGRESVRDVVRACGELGIEVLTLYAFSVENWRRPRREVWALMRLLRDTLYEEVEELDRNNVRLIAIGRLDELPKTSREALFWAMKRTKDNTGLMLNLALNYGGRVEIVDAVRRILEGGYRPEDVDEAVFSAHLYTAGLPDPDLLIRTSGELRVSNFLLWQMAYTEIWVTDVLWPDFRRKHLYQAIEAYQRRERRFGMTSEQLRRGDGGGR
ncbi:MAG TPA: isoprenyl transferase [Candidatus Latescibacteria bacterium]|nr:isoprenyl transferase [Candidatus Latescibacterota bacterium]